MYDISCVFSIFALRIDFLWPASDGIRGGQVLVAGATSGYTEAPCMVRHAFGDSSP